MTFSSTNNGSVFPSLSSYMMCLITKPTSTIFLAYVITNTCFQLPLSTFILYHGLQQWRKRSSSSAAPASHSDCFSYHLTAMELIGVTGYILTSCGIYKKDTLSMRTGTLAYSLTWFGEMSFHMLTCVELYLAVVHPLVYLNLKNGRWIRVRNIITGVVWLLCFSWICLMIGQYFVIINVCLVILSISVVSFCNISVLVVLIRPGPGEQGGGRERADGSKQRAFYIIMAILGALMLRCAWGVFWTVIYLLEKGTVCVIITIDVWVNLPSSLIVPLLFLHRTGRCLLCKKNIPSV